MDDRRIQGDDFRDRVARAASGFQSAGIGAGDFIAVLVRNESARTRYMRFEGSTLVLTL